MTGAPTFDDIFETLAAASVGHATMRVPLPDDPSEGDVATRLAIAVNLLLDDVALRSAELEATHKVTSEARFQAITESAQDGIVTADEQGNITHVNPSMAVMVRRSVGELVGKPLTLLMPERLRSGHLAGLRRFLATRESRIMGAPIKLVAERSDGVEVPVEVALTHWNEGDRVFFTGILRDTTERTRLEDELRASRDLLASAELSAKYGSFEIDVATMAIKISDGFKAAFGLPPESDKKLEELTGMVVEEDRQTAMDVTRGALTAVGSVYFKYRLRRADGEVRPFDVTMETLPGPDGKPARVIGIARDLTDRARADARVKESEERFAAFFHNSPLPFTITRLADGVFLEVNDAFTQALGWTRAEAVGRTAHELGILPAPGARAKAIEGIAQSGRVAGRELRLKAKEGREVDFMVSMTRIISGGQDCIAAGFMDVTERNRARSDLERTAVELKAANAELDAFSYSVSHDLRAPLRSMDGFSRMLLEEAGPSLSPRARHQADTIIDSAREMSHLVDDLLALSRLARQALRPETIAPRPIVEKVLADLQPMREGRQTRIAIGDLPPCQADPALLKQVYVNLLSNALKYTRKRDFADIQVGWTAQDGGSYFVQDNGVGFDMQYASRLFGVFQRLHRAEEYEGTGVGLAIVHRIVTRHGGRVWADAAVDKGATFHFTLQGENHP